MRTLGLNVMSFLTLPEDNSTWSNTILISANITSDFKAQEATNFSHFQGNWFYIFKSEMFPNLKKTGKIKIENKLVYYIFVRENICASRIVFV